jgi:predicted transcriptional regulator of viral defense system
MGARGKGYLSLGRYPVTDRPELVLWSLWSRNIEGIPQGIWSHETALDIHELSDVMPAKMHMTVPPNFRRRKELPRVLYLHRCALVNSDVEERQGYKVTTPFRTIIDCITEGTVGDNFIAQAIHQAIKRGLLLESELEVIQRREPVIYQKIKRILQW